MFSTKTHWYLLFEQQSDFFDLFSLRNTIVYKGGMFGEVLLVKEKDNYFAFKSKCPHQGKSLDGCWIQEDKVVCPHHQYAFSLENGRGHGLYLDKYFLKFENGSVYLGKEKWSIF